MPCCGDGDPHKLALIMTPLYISCGYSVLIIQVKCKSYFRHLS